MDISAYTTINAIDTITVVLLESVLELKLVNSVAHITPNIAPDAPAAKRITSGLIRCDTYTDTRPDAIPEPKYIIAVRSEPTRGSSLEPNM